MEPPYTGRCFCGRTAYRILAAPLTVYACHCTDCQKRSGSAFGLSIWVPRTAIEGTQGEPARLEVTAEDGRVRIYRFCSHCATRLWSEPQGRDVIIVRAGTLDDTSWLRPVAHVWTRSAQTWFPFPEGAVRYETQPPDSRELIALWHKRSANPAT